MSKSNRLIGSTKISNSMPVNPANHPVSVAKFYDSLFLNLDLSFVSEFPKTGRKGFSNHAMICAFIVMKCEGFSMVTDLVDYLNNNLALLQNGAIEMADLEDFSEEVREMVKRFM